jgi:uncharacterized DUF497 family protein
VRFTFDPAKSVRNRAKHGIDFEEAQAIWLDADRLEIAARTIGELRWQVIGPHRRPPVVGHCDVSP